MLTIEGVELVGDGLRGVALEKLLERTDIEFATAPRLLGGVILTTLKQRVWYRDSGFHSKSITYFILPQRKRFTSRRWSSKLVFR